MLGPACTNVNSFGCTIWLHINQNHHIRLQSFGAKHSHNVYLVLVFLVVSQTPACLGTLIVAKPALQFTLATYHQDFVRGNTVHMQQANFAVQLS